MQCAELTLFALDRAYAAGQLPRVLEPVRVRPTMVQDRGEALANFFLAPMARQNLIPLLTGRTGQDWDRLPVGFRQNQV